jgi:ferredoxin-NADP reductase
MHHRIDTHLARPNRDPVKREDDGLVSRWLHDEVRLGDKIEIEAPNGTFFFTGPGGAERR